MDMLLNRFGTEMVKFEWCLHSSVNCLKSVVSSQEQVWFLQLPPISPRKWTC